jgi:hypothetical protein
MLDHKREQKFSFSSGNQRVAGPEFTLQNIKNIISPDTLTNTGALL